MKRLLFLFSFLSITYCNAQNYQCLQAGVQHYFTNGNGYLRGIRIDSVITSGSDNIFYPYKTKRKKPTTPYAVFDTVMGSWLGGKVLMQSDGTFLFDNYWNDTVVIKSNADISDVWTFYDDSSSKYYTAAVISIDTMTVLGVVDSVKKIVINAYLSGVLDPSDSLNNFEILLSKNYGFVKVFDLYTFPYRFASGLNDYYFQKSIVTSYGGFSYFTQAVPFKLADFHNPSQLEIYNYNVGDVFEWRTLTSINPMCFDCTRYTGLQSRKILTKDISDPYSIQYVIQYDAVETDYHPLPTVPTHYETHKVDTAVYDTSLLFPLLRTYMPEEQTEPYNSYYFAPEDTSCKESSFYAVSYPDAGYGLSVYKRNYKKGFGNTFTETRTYFNAGSGFEGHASSSIYNRMIYSLAGGVSCGEYIDIPVHVPLILEHNLVNVYPNPTKNELSITSANTIESISMINVMGQEVYSKSFNAKTVLIDVSPLLTGIYFLRINGVKMNKFVKE